MHKIFTWIRRLLAKITTANRIDPDPVSTMSPRDLADPARLASVLRGRSSDGPLRSR